MASPSSSGTFGENVKTATIAVLLAMVFRSLLFEPFHIPSGSMKSTLLEGDYLFVTKYSYGYSQYSFPFGLVSFAGRIFEESEPKRGDVVVFRPPGDIREDYIKRVIGLPGDRIQMKEGDLYINGKLAPKEYVDDWLDTDKTPPALIKRYKETLPNGVTHAVLYQQPFDSPEDNTEVYTVPEGHYFMMGDNRDNSRDSRFGIPVGYVPAENLIGRADLILFSWSFAGGFHLRERFFVLIH